MDRVGEILKKRGWNDKALKLFPKPILGGNSLQPYLKYNTFSGRIKGVTNKIKHPVDNSKTEFCRTDLLSQINIGFLFELKEVGECGKICITKDKRISSI